MAQSMVQMVLFLAVLVFIADARTPPGIANNPSNARCLDSKYKTCYNLVHVCPKFCPNSCTVHCQSCKPICAAVPETPPVVVTPPLPSPPSTPTSTPTPPKTECDKPGAVCQDPRFVGGDGNIFYFHGKKNQDFCLLSDSNLHINAHFIGRRNSNMKRDFTWVQSIGVLFDNHQIFVGAQKTSTWEDSTDRLALSFDGEPIFLEESKGAKWQSDLASGVSFTRSSDTNAIVVEVEGKFRFTAHVVPITEQDSKVHNYGVTKEDCFAHLDLGFKFYELSDEVDGVLGKTYRGDYVSTVKKGVSMPIMGGEKNFSSSSLFSTDCKVARFGASVVGIASETSEYPSISCGSGIGGRGVVCKR